MERYPFLRIKLAVLFKFIYKFNVILLKIIADHGSISLGFT